MRRTILSLVMAAGLVAPAAAQNPDLADADARAVLARAKEGEFTAQVLNGGLVRQVCSLRGAVDGSCVYQCNDGYPLRRAQPAGECPKTVLQDNEPEFTPKGWQFPGRGPWDQFPGDGRRPGNGRRPPSRQAVDCSATDHGWEEHWGGHVSRGWDLYGSAQAACRACKQPTGPHGDCSVSCGTPEFRCSYEFVPDNGGPATDSGYGDQREDSRDAEDSATNICMRNNWGRPGRCRVRGCDRQDRTLLRERCR